MGTFGNFYTYDNTNLKQRLPSSNYASFCSKINSTYQYSNETKIAIIDFFDLGIKAAEKRIREAYMKGNTTATLYLSLKSYEQYCHSLGIEKFLDYFKEEIKSYGYNCNYIYNSKNENYTIYICW